jgi:hypothetical protein
MSKIASKILGLFLSDVTAGACVADRGCCCGKRNHAVSCLGTCVKNPVCHTGPSCGPI